MAYILTPRFAPAYQAPHGQSFGFCGQVSRPTYTYRVSRSQPRRPQYSSFNNFFSQVDELLSEIDREAQRQAQLEAYVEAQREAHRLRQQRKHSLRARFGITQDEQGWQINGDIHGFNQDTISIEVTDEHTLKIIGNTRWQSELVKSGDQRIEAQQTAPAIDQTTGASPEDKMNDITPIKPAVEMVAASHSESESDTESHKSYQATVEDDYEDLGAETSSLISSASTTSTVAESVEPKGKEKVVDQDITSGTEVAHEEESGRQEEERPHGSFERTFRFPERIDTANVHASFKDGVLSIVVPKAQALKTRRIAIL